MTQISASAFAGEVPSSRNSARRAVAAASIGNALEWYDFTIYALFAVYIGQNFFPSGSSDADLLKAFLAFGLGFVIRPIGAVVLGVYGDRAGRKAALTLTIMLMAAGTLVIAAAPTYAAIGIGAPILLLCGRVLQGFSAGGEVGGAAAFLVEHAPPAEKGKYASWLQASMAVSNIIGAGVATLVTTLLVKDEIMAWGWRIPFILGLVIAPVGLWLRKTLEETPQFRNEVERKQVHAAPLREIFGEHLNALLLGIGFSILWAVCVYSLIIFMPIYVQKTFGFAPKDAFTASLIGNVFMVVMCVTAGTLSDKFGRVRTMFLAALLLLLLPYPLLHWLDTTRTLAALIVVQSVFCILVASYVGVAPAMAAEIFPTRVRSTGMSLVYNTAITIFGGFAPAILTWLGQTSGTSFAPAFYVMGAAVVALFSLSRLQVVK